MASADDWPPAYPAQLNLADANVTSVLWATGFKLDFQFVDMPLVDEWGYPKHASGIKEIPGIYVVGLPWLTRHYSAIVGGVGLDARHIAKRISGRKRQVLSQKKAVGSIPQPSHELPVQSSDAHPTLWAVIQDSSLAVCPPRCQPIMSTPIKA